MEPTAGQRPLRPPAVRPHGWWFDAVLLVSFVALTGALAAGRLLDADVAVRDWADAHRPTALHWVARVLNFLGQGGWVLMPLAGGLGLALSWRTRSVRPMLPVVAAFLLTYLTLGPLKLWTNRAAPRSPLPDRVELFNDLPPGEYGESYPSGHVANAIVWYGVIALLLAALLRDLGRPELTTAARGALRVVPPTVVFCTTTYLNYHWLTDSLAGLLLGLLLGRLLARIRFDTLPLPRRLH